MRPPNAVRDGSYYSRRLGHGEGYRYPHDAAAGWVDQEYRPAEVRDEQFYEPGSHGAERELVDAWRARRGDATRDGGMHEEGRDASE